MTGGAWSPALARAALLRAGYADVRARLLFAKGDLFVTYQQINADPEGVGEMALETIAMERRPAVAR